MGRIECDGYIQSTDDKLQQLNEAEANKTRYSGRRQNVEPEVNDDDDYY